MNFERMQQAVAIIRDIPDDQLSLLYWQHEPPGENETFARNIGQTNCGTIACAAGWLALHPAMQEQGLYADGDGEPMFQSPIIDRNWPKKYGFFALSIFFDITKDEASELFGQRSDADGNDDEEPELSDKQVWLMRAEKLIAKYKEQA